MQLNVPYRTKRDLAVISDLIWCQCGTAVQVPRKKPRESQDFRCPKCSRQLRLWRTG